MWNTSVLFRSFLHAFVVLCMLLSTVPVWRCLRRFCAVYLAILEHNFFEGCHNLALLHDSSGNSQGLWYWLKPTINIYFVVLSASQFMEVLGKNSTWIKYRSELIFYIPTSIVVLILISNKIYNCSKEGSYFTRANNICDRLF